MAYLVSLCVRMHKTRARAEVVRHLMMLQTGVYGVCKADVIVTSVTHARSWTSFDDANTLSWLETKYAGAVVSLQVSVSLC
jgi:hypothetical protein